MVRVTKKVTALNRNAYLLPLLSSFLYVLEAIKKELKMIRRMVIRKSIGMLNW